MLDYILLHVIEIICYRTKNFSGTRLMEKEYFSRNIKNGFRKVSFSIDPVILCDTFY